MPGGSRSSSRQNSASSQSSEKDYALSVNIYGRGDPAKHDAPAHWGAMLSRRGEKHGDLYHVRKNDDFFYEDPVLRRPVESNTSYGRSEVTYLSNRRKESAAQVLDAYGKEKSNIPSGNANCQHWTVGALDVLERESLAPQGTRDYWKQISQRVPRKLAIDSSEMAALGSRSPLKTLVDEDLLMRPLERSKSDNRLVVSIWTNLRASVGSVVAVVNPDGSFSKEFPIVLKFLDAGFCLKIWLCNIMLLLSFKLCSYLYTTQTRAPTYVCYMLCTLLFNSVSYKKANIICNIIVIKSK
jgi:hypothetical protein